MMTREVMTVVIPKSNDKTGHWHCAGHRVGTRPEAAQVSRRQPAGSRPPAGSHLEPARPEMAGGALRNVSSKTRATEPGQKSWDFDESEQDFGEKRNPPKPHASP
jgi:hypothetical protein